MTLAHPSLEQMSGELHVGEEFLAKYNRPGPRYTSYPTAPVWNDAFGPADLEHVHEEAERAKTPVSLYMHIPFCESLCLFCACNVVIQKNKNVAPPYLDVLKQEMKRISRSVSKNRPVVQFHWGGGTPTYLTPEQIEDLFAFTKEQRLKLQLRGEAYNALNLVNPNGFASTNITSTSFSEIGSFREARVLQIGAKVLF